MGLLIFDLDGTLIDSKESILECIEHGFRAIGCEDWVWDRSQATRHSLQTTLKNAALVANAQIGEKEEALFVSTYRKHHSEFRENSVRPYEGVVETLENLRSRNEFKIAIATTKHSEQARAMLERLKMAEYFDHIQGTDPGMKYKPEPDILHAVLEKLSARAEHASYAGDAIHDLHAADAAGLLKIAVHYGYSTPEELSPASPHIRLDKFEEILKYADLLKERAAA